MDMVAKDCRWLSVAPTAAQIIASAVLSGVPPSTASAAEIYGYLVLTTDYVWRGVSQSDGHGAIQLGGDVTFDSGIYAGVWGSTIDIDTGPGRQRDSQLNPYLGYSRELGDRWALAANAVAYRYPDQGEVVDYDFEELTLSANYDDRVWIEYAWSPDLYNTGRETHNVEIYAEAPLGKHVLVGGGAGYYDISKLVGDGYVYWELGVTWPLNRFDFDLRYHDTSGWVQVTSSADDADPRIAFSIRFTF